MINNIKKLEKYLAQVTELIANPVPEKHKLHEHSYRDHLKNEFERTSKKLEALKLAMPSKK